MHDNVKAIKPFLDFLQNVFYLNAINTLKNHQFDKNIYGLRLSTWIKIFIEGWNSINIHQSCSNLDF
jgi:hypothetical protein